MAVEIVTKDDLFVFRKQLIEDFKSILAQALQPGESPKGYKSAHVREILGCSVNKLVSLRIARKLRAKKAGGTICYNKEDVKRLLEEGFD